MKGWLYVIFHDAMPGLVKIGYSMRDPELRARELAGTGIPGAYKVAYAALVENPRDLEKALHQELGEYREGREWFRCEVAFVLAYLRKDGFASVLYEYGLAGLAEDEKTIHGGLHSPAVLPCPGCGKWLKVSSEHDVRFRCPRCKREFIRFEDGRISKG